MESTKARADADFFLQGDDASEAAAGPLAAELEQILSEFNDTSVPFPRERLIHEIFERQVNDRPDAVAIMHERGALTYAELNAKANQCAHHLRELGLESNEYVPVLMPRCLEMLIAQLAILKCGGVYLPLDPGLPAERKAFILRDCKARRVLSGRDWYADLDEQQITIVDYVSLSATLATCSTHNLATPLKSSAPAYVMYTSGSTGFPKGVVVPHVAVNRLVANCTYVRLSPDDCLAHSSNPAFDASTFEVWGALLNGARVLVVPQQTLLDAKRFASLLQQNEVTVLWITVGLLTQYAEALADVLPRIRYLITGGDVVDPGMVGRILRHSRPRHLLNAYGPTECTTFSTTFEVSLASTEHQALPIGRPISNTRVHILDSDRQPVPIGIAGEIYIGGPGVALGYLNRPELTAERFVRDPFCPNDGARLYKSGDMGRWRVDGNIEFLGRNDSQVKVRGFRVELGEIESKLLQHSHVREAVVLARQDAPGDKRLVGYIVADQAAEAPTPLDAETLYAHLKHQLPDYMLPRAFVLLERFPLTVNGKLDRGALPAPERTAFVLSEYEGAQTTVESVVAELWQDLLRIERVGRQDNFFMLGGHSLLVVQLLDRLRNRNLCADAADVYENPTLAGFASTLTAGRKDGVTILQNLIPPGCEAIAPQMLPLVSLQAEQIERIVRSVPGGARNIQDIYPLAPLQEGLLFHHWLDQQGGDTYVLPILVAFSSRTKLGQFVAALQRVIARHDILRTAILTEDLPQSLQVVYRHVDLPVEHLTLDAHRDIVEQLKERMRPEAQHLDVRRAPLLRLEVAATDHAEQCFALLKLHHVMCDHESVEAMLEEIKTLLDEQGRDLPEPMPYRNHVIQALEHNRRHDAEKFFRERFADVEQPTAPFGLRDIYNDGSQNERVVASLSSELATRLRSEARRVGVSPATLFHAAWALVLAHTAGSDDVVFGTVLLGRLHGDAGAQRTLGLFINTLPLRLRLRGVTASTLVERTNRELIALLNHEHASLALAQRCSGMQGAVPLFSALINYLHSTVDIETGQPSIAEGVTVVASQEWTNYPFALSIYDQGQGFGLMLKADKRVSARRMVSYLVTALQSLTDALVSRRAIEALDLSIVPEQERHQMLEEFNNTRAPCPERLIHELFDEQAQRTPDALAVVCDGISLTFSQLSDRANRLAWTLKQAGVEPGRTVALCVERCAGMVVGMLAILKAGGAYVPVDPNYPIEKQAALLRAAGPAALLIQQHLLNDRLDNTVPLVLLRADGSSPATEQTHAGWFDSGVRPADLAYVIFTSGSTGEPKGVMVEHRHVVNLWQSLKRIYDEVPECGRIAVNAPFNFDASVKQFVQLLSGRTLFPVPQEVRLDAAQLLDFLASNRIEGIDCTPSQLKGWLSEGLLAQESSALRLVLVGGEAIDPGVWITLARSRTIQFYNVYGPTECTVDATAARINGDSRATPHIGAPMENARLCVLDRDGRPAPLDVAGEIHIGGARVARGYFNQPQLTAERFRDDPFDTFGGRLYRTGDLGRWRADGTIEYLGRNDHQVKIRGFRIETGEVEAQLLQHPQVREAVVIAQQESTGDQRLVAYIAADVQRLTSAEGGQGRAAPQDATADMVAQWNKIHDETYADGNTGPSFIGWKSSYTGQLIPEAQMQEWLEATVERIQALQPKRVLEIGCGVGLILQHIAPRCDVYVGTDFSLEAIAQLRTYLAEREDLQHVQLLHRAATELSELSAGSFDTVILNSVVQYFPDIDYLLAVLGEAVRLVTPRGHIFVGDVRHHGLLRTFHAAVQLSKAAASVTVGQLRRRISRTISQEKELVVDPQFFAELPDQLPGIGAVRLQLKRGRAPNELTRYRYDVVLRTEASLTDIPQWETVDWSTDVRTEMEFERALRAGKWQAVHVHSIPNARLARELAARQVVDSSPEELDASSLRRQLNEMSFEGVEPERCWELARASGYEIDVFWDETVSRFGVFMRPGSADFDFAAVAAGARAPRKHTRVLANYPLETSLRQQLVPRLRQFLKEQLPEYMIPSAWVVLAQLPLTANGKVDRRSLPAVQGRADEAGEYVAPETPMEHTLAEIWEQVLQVDQVGVNDSFFEIGGHSLLAMQVVVRVRSLLAADLPLSAMFDCPTVRTLCARIEELRMTRVIDEIEAGGAEMEELLERIAAMPDSAVKERVRELEG